MTESTTPPTRTPCLVRIVAVLATTLLIGLAGLTTVQAHADPRATGPTLLSDTVGLYPRAIQIAHAVPGSGVHNGDIVAADVTFQANNGLGAIYASSDQGGSFTRIGTVADPESAGGRGLCCSTLYELPQRVGALPAGTLLWSASIGQSTTPRRMSIRIWQSQDDGHSWSFLSTADTATNTGGLWEPEFTVATDGQLVMFVSDETDQPAHSQKLVQTESRDGVTWTAVHDTVSLPDPAARPGMPIVRNIPAQGYLMTYEVCGPGFDCAVHYRRSSDGVHWGDPTDAGSQIVGADGTYFLHTPTIAWTPGVSRDGQLFLIGQLLRNPDGSVAPGNGRTVMVSTHGPAGPWRSIAAPVPVADPYDNYCPNYSSTLLPLRGGTRLLEIATAYAPDGACLASFGTASGRA